VENINNISWEAMIEEHLAEPEARHLCAQARALLDVLYEGLSFEETLAEILKAEPRTISAILATNPFLTTHGLW